MKHVFKTVAAFIVTIVLTTLGAFGIAPANAASDVPFTEVRDGVAIVHVGATVIIDLNSSLAEGEWACKPPASTENLYASVDTELNWLFITEWQAGTDEESWLSCSRTAPAKVHDMGFQAYDVETMSATFVKKYKKMFGYAMPNTNTPVLWPNGDTALNNEAICMTGSFAKSEPEHTFVVDANKSKSFRSAFGPKRQDWICAATQDGTLIGYRDSSLPGGLRAKVHMPATVEAWGRTFGSRPTVG